MKTPLETAKALLRIQTEGRDNTSYNIELESVDPRWYYGANNRIKDLPPHVAVFLNVNDNLADWPNCECLLLTEELEAIAIYPL